MANALIAQIRDVIERYHVALDNGDAGALAAYNGMQELQELLDMPWVQGEALKRWRSSV